MPGFLDRLAARARHDGFYAGLAEGAKEFLREELRAAGVEPDDLPALEPRQEADAPEGCSFSCGAGPGMEEER
jgi:hypothetical protein